MKERILEILSEALPQIDFTASNALVDDGILDSISIVTLVTELSQEFGVVFDLEELAPENLNSIDAITETVTRLKNG
ncbi:MAG: acyl carrier protein [Oscillospiraceae bacterium]|nr:acyl carrier protein [Oscillospiraceae bacterium]